MLMTDLDMDELYVIIPKIESPYNMLECTFRPITCNKSKFALIEDCGHTYLCFNPKRGIQIFEHDGYKASIEFDKAYSTIFETYDIPPDDFEIEQYTRLPEKLTLIIE